MDPVFTLVLAGGSGTRLWPLSREEFPKQFLRIEEGCSLYQCTLRRAFAVGDPARTRVLSSVRFGAMALLQAREMLDVPQSFVVEEPCPKNTAPAIALGLLALMEECGATRESVVFVCPSDHIIYGPELFQDAVRSAAAAARAGNVCVFGIPPTRPDTGFGYVRAGEPFGEWRKVERFVEKPSSEKAEEYLKTGGYFWNGGMFVFTVGTMLDALAEHLPETAPLIEKGYDAFLDAFPALPSISIDYAVLERIPNVALVPLEAPWTDIGSWDALYEFSEKDAAGNVVKGRIVAEGCSNSLFLSTKRLVAAVDVSDFLIVDSPDALLIAPRGSSQRVRAIVDRLKAENAVEVVRSPEGARPWGGYELLHQGERFAIKRVTVLPGKRLSLQYHHHRSEHWVVVRGTALVTRDGEERYVNEGESVFIPKHCVHRLENPGKVTLELVEIRGGEYIEEDDIVRIEDDYGRTTAR